jgi:hypothetical protein
MSEKTREQSAVDVIYEMKSLVEKLDKKLDILDGNIKLLNNKVVKLQKTVNNLTLAPAPAAKPKAALKSQKPEEPNIIRTGKRSDKYVTGPIRTFGKIMSKGRKPIPDVQVAVFNEQNEVIKTRKTDSKGYWEVRLPEGRYGVQYTHKKFKPINITIELDKSITEYEVK